MTFGREPTNRPHRMGRVGIRGPPEATRERQKEKVTRIQELSHFVPFPLRLLVGSRLTVIAGHGERLGGETGPAHAAYGKVRKK